MSVDKNHPYFMIAKPYTMTPIAETMNLADAARIATAITMHYGIGMEVNRMVPMADLTPHKKVPLFSISPTNIDWRKVQPEHALLIKSLSHDLEPIVHTLFEPELEGATS